MPALGSGLARGSATMFTVLDRVSLAGLTRTSRTRILRRARRLRPGSSTPRSFPAPPPVMHDKSDAAWLAPASRTSGCRTSRRRRDDGAALVRHVMEEARAAFFPLAPPERHAISSPGRVGAMTLVRRSGRPLDVWTFADTTAFVRQPDGAVVTVGRRARTCASSKCAKAADC